MSKYIRSVISLCLVSLILAGMTPIVVRAADGRNDADSPIRLYATALAGPIASIVDAPPGAALEVNRSTIRLGDSIWAGDLLRLRQNARVTLLVDDVGRVTLNRGAMVRLWSRRLTIEGGTPGHVLSASLIAGDMTVDLKGGAEARVQSCGLTLSASNGAAFVARVSDGSVSVERTRGDVTVETQTEQHNYGMSPVGHGSVINVKEHHLVNVRIRVVEDGNPVPDVPVVFTLGEQGAVPIGTLGLGTVSGSTYTSTTDAEGIASVPFTAPRHRGSVAITANIPRSGASWAGTINVVHGDNVQGKTVLFLVLAGGAAAGAAVAATRDHHDKITILPPEGK